MKEKIKQFFFRDIELLELIKGSLVSFLFKVIGFICNYAFIFLITRNLGAGSLGVFSIAFSILMAGTIIGKLGLDTSSIKYISHYAITRQPNALRLFYFNVLRVVIPFSIFLSLSFFLFSNFIADHIFHKPYLTNPFKIISLAIFPMVIIYINSESLRGLKKIREYTIIQNVAKFILAIVILSMLIVFYKNINIAIISFTISVYIVAIISFFIWLRYLNPSKNTTESSININSIMNVSMPILFHNILMLIMGFADTFMLGIFKSDSDVGTYNIALKLATIISFTLTSINSISAPKFSELHSIGDTQKLKKVVVKTTKLTFWTSFPFLLVCFIMPTTILGFFGEEFKLASKALIFICIGQFVNSISGSVGYFLQMTGKQRAVRDIILITAVINIVLNYFLIPRFGINGAAFTNMVSICFWNISAVYIINKQFNIFTIYIPFITR